MFYISINTVETIGLYIIEILGIIFAISSVKAMSEATNIKNAYYGFIFSAQIVFAIYYIAIERYLLLIMPIFYVYNVIKGIKNNKIKIKEIIKSMLNCYFKK